MFFTWRNVASAFILLTVVAQGNELRVREGPRDLVEGDEPPPPFCTNSDVAGTGIDNGCDSTNPMCVTSTNAEPGANAPGAKCAPCVNSVLTAASGPDKGCDNAEPICALSNGADPAHPFAGTQCIPIGESNCLNDGPNGSPDTGCPPERTLCVNAAGTEIPADTHGKKCVKCRNAFGSTAFTDFGCTNSDPICLKADNTRPAITYSGTQCRPRCPNWSQTLSGFVNGTERYYNSGNALPAGTYKATYTDGCFRFHDGNNLFNVNYYPAATPDDYRWFLVGATTSDRIVKLKPFPPSTNPYSSYAACVAGNSASTDRSVTFVLTAPKKVGLWLFDEPYYDNAAGTKNPTWKLERTDPCF